MENEYKIVDFTYCDSCKYRDTKEVKDPCNECLDNTINLHSHKPVNYKEREKEVK